MVTGSRLMVFPLADCARGPYAGLQRWCSAVQCVASHRRAWEGERSLARLHAFLASPCFASPKTDTAQARAFSEGGIHSHCSPAGVGVNDASEQLIAIGLHFQLHCTALRRALCVQSRPADGGGSREQPMRTRHRRQPRYRPCSPWTVPSRLASFMRSTAPPTTPPFPFP